MDKKANIKDLPANERPYERFYRLGGEALSDQELLAIILGSGSKGMNAIETASVIMAKFAQDTGLGSLKDISVEELMQVKGVGLYKAIRLKAVFEIAARSVSKIVPAKLECSNPREIADFYQYKMENLPREELWVLFLNNKNLLIREKIISTGGLSATVIYPRDVFREAIRANSAAIVLMHNHPSGNPLPSPDDLETTSSFVQAGQIIGIRVHDHLIFGKGKYISLASEGQFKAIFSAQA